MALWDEVKSRYKTAALKSLTNKDDPTAVAVDDTQGTRAATAAEADFQTYAGETYDSTIQRHVETAVRGVIAFLFEWGGSAVGITRIKHEQFIEECRALRKRGVNRRIKPSSTSGLTVTQDDAGDKSAFDTSRFTTTVPTNLRRNDDTD